MAKYKETGKELTIWEERFFYLHHLFMLLGYIYINLITFKFKDMMDCYFWAKIHLTHNGKLVEIPKFKLFTLVNVYVLVGLVTSAFIIHILTKVLILIIKLI